MNHLAWVITAAPSYARSQTALEALKARGVPYTVVTCAAARVREYGDVASLISQHGHPVLPVPSLVAGSSREAQGLTNALTELLLVQALASLEATDVVVVADRAETVSVSRAAKQLGCTLWHLQGGEVSGSIDDRARHANTAFADWHLVATEQAAAHVTAMLAAQERDTSRVVLTGCPSVDLACAAARAPLTGILGGGTGADVDLTRPYAVVVEHPVTEEAEYAGSQIATLMAAMAELDGLPVVWQWPGPDAGGGPIERALSQMEHQHQERPWHYFHRMPPADYYRLLKGAAVLVGNSSVGIRECSALGVPVVNVGTRQRTRERGPNVIDVGYDAAAISSAVQWQAGRSIPRSSLYGDGHAGARIAEVIAHG